MVSFWQSSLVALLAASGLANAALVPYKGKAPELPQGRKPFGFGFRATGGAANASAVYIAENMVDLKDALQAPWARTVYVRGNINGAVKFDNVTSKNVLTNCAGYVAETAPLFNFTQYMMSWNASYMASLDALPETSVVEGKPVADFIALIKQQPVSISISI